MAALCHGCGRMRPILVGSSHVRACECDVDMLGLV
jgi:LSD1 subclass zinc finger protein